MNNLIQAAKDLISGYDTGMKGKAIQLRINLLKDALKDTKEPMVYLIDCGDADDEDKHPDELTDSEFIDIAENKGQIYTLKTFAHYFNQDELSNVNSYIRII